MKKVQKEFKSLKAVKDLIAQLETAVQELKTGVEITASTQSIAQDALRAGFQTTCSAGIANLFKIEKTTVEKCAEFQPRHEATVKETATEKEMEWRESIVSIPEKYRTMKLRNLSWWQFFARSKWKNMVMPQCVVDSFTVSTSKIDIPNGIITTEISMEFRVPEMYSGMDKVWGTKEKGFFRSFSNTVRHLIRDIGLAVGIVVFVHHSTTLGNRLHVVKEALAIGLKNIQVCFPSYGDGKIPDRDPIVVGYLYYTTVDRNGNKREQADMYILAWFGYDKTQPMICNI